MSPAVASPQETHLFWFYLTPLETRWRRQEADLRRLVADLDAGRPPSVRLIGLPAVLEQPAFDAVLRGMVDQVILSSVAAKPSARTVLEKTPSNSLCVGLINRLVPDARFIHVVRDPRQVVGSLLEARHSWADASWAPGRPASAARLWRRHFEGARQAAAFGPDRYLELRYEDLKKDPVAGVAAMLGFLGRDPADAPALVAAERDAAEKPAVEVFAISAGLRNRIGDRAVAEPQGFRSQGRPPLNAAGRVAVSAEVGDLLLDLGYDDGSWVGVSPAPHAALRSVHAVRERLPLLLSAAARRLGGLVR